MDCFSIIYRKKHLQNDCVAQWGWRRWGQRWDCNYGLLLLHLSLFIVHCGAIVVFFMGFFPPSLSLSVCSGTNIVIVFIIIIIITIVLISNWFDWCANTRLHITWIQCVRHDFACHIFLFYFSYSVVFCCCCWCWCWRWCWCWSQATETSIKALF